MLLSASLCQLSVAELRAMENAAAEITAEADVAAKPKFKFLKRGEGTYKRVYASQFRKPQQVTKPHSERVDIEAAVEAYEQNVNTQSRGSNAAKNEVGKPAGSRHAKATKVSAEQSKQCVPTAHNSQVVNEEASLRASFGSAVSQPGQDGSKNQVPVYDALQAAAVCRTFGHLMQMQKHWVHA